MFVACPNIVSHSVAMKCHLSLQLVLACLVWVAVSQDEGGGTEEDDSPSHSCPPLPSTKSSRVACTGGSCDRPKSGTRASAVIKKTLIKATKGASEVICSSSGQWVQAPPKGYLKQGYLGFFKPFFVGLAFEAADYICQQDGGRMMVIDTNEKKNIMKKIYALRPVLTVIGLNQTYEADNVWAGIMKTNGKQSFETIYGNSAEDIEDFEKRGTHTGAGASDCIVGYSRKNTGFKVLYYALPCSMARGFICEISDQTRQSQDAD